MKLSIALLATFITFAVCAPLLNAGLKTTIPNQYLVVLHKNITVKIRDAHVAELAARVFKLEHERILSVFDIGDLVGFAAILSKESLANELVHPIVRYVEADQVVSIYEGTETRQGATWGIDRIDQRTLPLSGTYTYYNSAGDRVFAYVIDTGILLTHNQFTSTTAGKPARAIFGIDTTGEGADDGNGHGTHVAGTIGGNIDGVAKNVTLVAVKVLNSGGSGSWQGVIDGVDWAVKNHTARFQASNLARSVANMSLGGAKTAALDEAVRNAALAGLHMVVAAGNNGADACNYSPANVLEVITVGATTSADARASYSNIGICVDVFAPGSNIRSAWIGSNTASNTISGTSMAAPHVCGAVAAHLGHLLAGNPLPPPSFDEIDKWVKTEATLNTITGLPINTDNRLLFSPYGDIDPTM